MSKSNLNIVKDEPTRGYVIVGKNRDGIYTGRIAYLLHYLFIYMMVCSIITTCVFLGLVVETVIN